VILDIGLPGTNGFDVCLDMKARPDLSGTVFIAHSGYGDEKYRTRATEVGFAHFLLKPFEMASLEAVLALAAEQVSRPGQAGA
jgi:DNA-binding response OmpR family regulator